MALQTITTEVTLSFLVLLTMGKVSKAKKKRCKAAALLVKSKDNVIEGTDSSDTAVDDDDSDVDTSDSGVISDADMIVSINILNLVGRRSDIYESKSMKSLRTALFPLIQLQISKGSHFESCILDNSTLNNCLEEEVPPRKLSTLLRTATTYSNDSNLFLSPNIKPFRAALHPLVIAQQRRLSKKPSLTSITESLNQTHSSRVSAAFRSRNWSLALHELYQMYQSSESPKLGKFYSFTLSTMYSRLIDSI